MVYKHAYLNTLLLLHSPFMLSVVKMPLKVGAHALNCHGNYIVDHGNSWKNRGIVFLNFCGNPDIMITPRNAVAFVIIHLQESKRETRR